MKNKNIENKKPMMENISRYFGIFGAIMLLLTFFSGGTIFMAFAEGIMNDNLLIKTVSLLFGTISIVSIIYLALTDKS